MTFKEGDKVKVVANIDSKLKSFIGKHGKVTGSITAYSCRVKLAYDNEYWFDNRELELDTSRRSE